MTSTLFIDNVYITDELYQANTFFKRLKGYMFDKTPRYRAIMISPCNSIHTYFMRFNIDVLFLDENYKVVKKYENLGKNKIISPVKSAKYVIEAKAYTFRSYAVGNEIEIK